ncbi:MAG: TIGR02281 family clan AA aspartic protease [Pseudomonadota bacterium]
MRTLIVTCCIAAFAAPFMVQQLQVHLDARLGSEVTTPPAVSRSVSKPARTERQTSPLQPVYKTSAGTNPGGGKRAMITAGRDGHFRPKAKLNRVTIPVMVDTGASTIALNKSTARRVGIRGSGLRYNVRVSTANGEVMAARAILDSVSVGRITVRNVEALVLDDNALDTVLLGNSFLSRLKSYRVSDGKLILQN